SSKCRSTVACTSWRPCKCHRTASRQRQGEHSCSGSRCSPPLVRKNGREEWQETNHTRSVTVRIIQITDTHLSPLNPHFNRNWQPLVAWIEEQKPDLIIHTGDVSVDGADIEADLEFCRSCLDELSAPTLVLPGNHDIGHLPESHQPVNSERLARWNRHFGADRWAQEHGGWTLIGLNSLIIGSGEAAEEEQFEWLEGELANSSGKPVAVFAHKPLFVDSPDEGDSGYWGIRPAARQRLYDLFAAHN